MSGNHVTTKGTFLKKSRARRIAISYATIIALIVTCLVPAAVSAADWPSYRGDPDAKGITATEAPRTQAETVQKWAKQLGGNNVNTTNPIYVGSKIYIAICKLDSATYEVYDAELIEYSTSGKKLRSIAFTLPAGRAPGIPLSSNIGYGAGTIFVPLSDGTISAVKVSTFKQLWKSAAFAESSGMAMAINSSIIYRGGYIYSGAMEGYGTAAGVFFALNASNGKTAWQYNSTKAYYNAGAVFTKKAVIFAGDDGKLVSHDLKTAKVFGTYDVVDPVRSETVLADGNIYVTTGNATTGKGRLYRVPLNKNGTTFNASKAKSVALSGGRSTAQPVVYRDKVYAFSGQSDIYGTEIGKLDVFNASTLKKKATKDTGAYVDGEPLLTTAYATEANKYKIYIYVLQDSEIDNLLAIEDSGALSAPKVRTIYKPGGDHASSSVIAGDDGVLYFRTTKTDQTTWYVSATLHAVSHKSGTVKFNVNGGKALAKSKRTKIVFSGTKYGKLPAPTRKGYTFKGWYTKKKSGSKITAASSVKSVKTRTLYAHWKKK
jgi:uncharacterized repeat protein (TIGR02543 family)